MLNWSQTVTYSSSGLIRPESLDSLRRVVSQNSKVKALGSRHSFNDSADTEGIHVALDSMPPQIAIDGDCVTCGAGVTHSELSIALHQHGLALPNLASLPHISVGGAIQTGTHGSGSRNAALSDNVTALHVVDATGELHTLTGEDADFPALVVGLGAFGIVYAVTQRCVPAFDVTQTVFENLPWDQVLLHLEEMLSSAYSVSVFTRYDSVVVPQVWVKQLVGKTTRFDFEAAGATAARRTLHPLPETSADNVTDQLGIAGASHDRLPHFRHDFKPGRGDEIQSEYLLDVKHGVEAVSALRRLGDQIAPLLHMAEIRRVAPDGAWLSPSGDRDTLAFHFTWKRMPSQVDHVLDAVEEALLPFGARPHWGKTFHYGHRELQMTYPRMGDFVDAVRRWDPDGKFENGFLRRVLGAT